jgi:hypothetical protein
MFSYALAETPWHGHCHSRRLEESMKKLFALILNLAILTVAAAPSFAQGRNRRCNNDSGSYNSRRNYDSRGYYDNSRVYSQRSYDSRVYTDNSRAYYDYGYRNRNFWDRHRDKLTVGIGTGAGAVVGAMIGGKRGAIIGALAGAGGSALYTYKIRNRRYRY